MAGLVALLLPYPQLVDSEEEDQEKHVKEQKQDKKAAVVEEVDILVAVVADNFLVGSIIF